MTSHAFCVKCSQCIATAEKDSDHAHVTGDVRDYAYDCDIVCKLQRTYDTFYTNG